MRNFLTVNSILAAVIAFLINSVFSNIQIISIILIIGISIIGFFVSITWYYVMRRNSDYMHFQRCQLYEIEKKLGNPFTTFTNMYNVFDLGEGVPFSFLEKPFTSKKQSANKLEGWLPLIIAVSWVILIVSCGAFLIQTITTG